MAWARAAFRVQRFEVVAAIVIATILAISGVVVWYRLGALGVPAECWATFATSGYSESGPCGDRLFAFGLINGDEAGKIMAAMAVVPWLLGFMLGVPLVAREIEGGSAPLVWSLVRSRRRWLAGRLLPILALLVVLSVVLWAVSDLLWSAREPWQPIPNFGDVGLHGSVVLGKAIAALAVGLIVGALLGRTLPAFLVTLAVGAVIVSLAGILMSAWFMTEATKHAIPIDPSGNLDESAYPGGTSFFTGWMTPTGAIVYSQEEMAAFAPPGVDFQTWLSEEAPLLQMGLPGSVYPTWSVIETVGFGAAGIVGLLIAFPIIERRRPM
jgi:hypothetical protein